MKKRIIGIMLCGMLAVSSLTACGGSEAVEEAVAEAVEEAVEEAAEEVEAEGEEMCSDDVFAELQDEYAYLKEEYDLIEDYYMNNDNIPQDDDVESLLADATDYLEQMGEITQDSITDEDAEELAQSMLDVAEALAEVAEGLELVSDVNEAAGEMCSDETFAELQDVYASLSELNDIVVDYYLNNDNVAQDDDVESLLNDAADYLEQMGEITQDSITEEDAVELAQSMSDVADALAVVADAL